MVIRIFGLACLLVLAGHVEAVARCSPALTIYAFDNQTVEGRIYVRGGTPCAIRVRSSAGPTYSAHIVEKPSVGTVTIDGRDRIVYKPRPGFTGSDTFTYARKGETTRGEPSTRTVRVLVAVRP